MTFKNDLEKKCFQIAAKALGDGVTVEHNKTLRIESALFPEVAAFKGPPAKEIDVLIAPLRDVPRVVLLISCKLLARRAEPAHVQEWCAVVQAMNKYSDGTLYLGLVVSPLGFTSGCEAWATSHNVAIIPPLKGRRLDFDEDTVLRMFQRVLTALHKRVQLQFADLASPPAFFNFVYELVADFEGHKEAAVDGRYLVLPHQWASSFDEMYAKVAGRIVDDLLVTDRFTVLNLSGGVTVVFDGARVEFGAPSSGQWRPTATPRCFKNISMDECTLDFIKSVAVGKRISSGADFGSYVEFGLDGHFNLGLHQDGFHVISTENPIREHQL